MIEGLIAFIYTQFATNQLLIAGIGTVVSGSLLYLARSVPRTIYLALKRYFSIEFTILSKNDNYEDILEVLNQHKINFFSRNFSVTENGKHIIPGIGRSFSWINGRFLSYDRSLLDTKMQIEEQTKITIFSRNKKFVQKILDMAMKDAEREQYIYSQEGTHWHRSGNPYGKRTMDSIFIDEKVKENIIKRIEWFYENKQWYLDRGITYKLCICLYGPPGTGKTSLIRALASKFRKDIRFFDSMSSLNSIQWAGSDSFIVMEDIDHLLADKNSEGEGEKKSSQHIQKLLNSIDGIMTPEGMVCIMTTNSIDNLPFALKRKGRVDESIFVPPMDKKETIRMFTTFFGEDQKPLIEHLPNDFSVVGAHVQDVIMTADSPWNAAEALHNLHK